jgi:hypothetical protein
MRIYLHDDDIKQCGCVVPFLKSLFAEIRDGGLSPSSPDQPAEAQALFFAVHVLETISLQDGTPNRTYADLLRESRINWKPS